LRALLACAGLLAGLWSFGPGTASAQTRTAELDRIQAPAQALPGTEQRVALVIGNSNYQNVARLENPDRDAQSVAELLNSAGFDVIAATDLTQNDLIKVVQNFSAKIAERGPNTVAMIYYAGHGVQVAGENYLIPVDARITTPSDLANNSLRLVDLMATLETIPSRLRIVMLDSCRNNPFPNIDDAGQGLAIVDTPQRSIVGYATAPGAEALDGSNGHSPYTQAFLTLAREPNLPIEQLFKRIRLYVNHVTDGEQTPWESSSAISDFVFFGDTAVAATHAPEHGPVVQMVSDMPWRSVDQVYDYAISEGSPQYYQEFVTRFPNDPRALRLRHLIADLALATAWHETVLKNSPLAYKSFYEHHMDSPYAKAALHLQAQPKMMPLLQSDHLLKSSTGFQHQLSLSSNARIISMSAHGSNAPASGKIVNLPVNNKGGDRELRRNGEHDFHHFLDHELRHNDVMKKPIEHTERRQTFNSFSNSNARMSSFRGNSGMHLNMGGGGFGRMGGFGRH
jgi:uncharacterized caspase-like protein